MPVTAKLSRKFYETFGEDLTNELVDWFNNVDSSYRAELREVNDANFVRFDAKLEQRLAELKRDLTIEISQNQHAILRWMFSFWLPTAIGIIGTAIAVVALFIRQ